MPIKINVIGHRGSSGLYPENTIYSMWKAVEEGASTIEFDVQLTKDHHLVIFHDRHFERFLKLDGSIGTSSLLEIRKLDVGKWKGHEGLKIPTLRELLQEFSGKINMCLEIKPQASDPKNILAQKILNELDDFEGLMQGYISVRDIPTYKYIANQTKKYKIGLMQKKRSPQEYHELLKDHSIRIAQPRFNRYDNNLYNELRKLVDEINVYPAHDREAWKYLVENKVNGMITNYPKRCVEYLKSIDSR